ncbi:MAG: hypothetical protein ACRD0C_01215 [Acidimicrobiia bacterium]
MTLKRAGLAGIVVVAIGAGGIGLLAGRDAVDAPRTANAAEATRQEAAPSGDLVEFVDEQAKFAISYPKAWVRAQSPNPQIPLIAAERDPAENQGGSILVRVSPLEAAVAREQLGEVRKVTDPIVAAGEGVELKAEPAEITQGGLPGLYYFYTFHDSVSGRRGAHAHYFLFQGQTMISLVFQALPEEDFIRLAPILDRVAASFRVL